MVADFFDAGAALGALFLLVIGISIAVSGARLARALVAGVVWLVRHRHRWHVERIDQGPIPIVHRVCADPDCGATKAEYDDGAAVIAGRCGHNRMRAGCGRCDAYWGEWDMDSRLEAELAKRSKINV